MFRRTLAAIGLAFAILLGLSSPVMAGGWAVVTLDSLPADIQAGTLYSIGFMVRQHGVTPIDDNPFEGGPLRPYLVATNQETRETVRVDARKEGEAGHFVVDITFPSAGTWNISITPPPFEGTQLGTMTVLAAASTEPAMVKQEASIVGIDRTILIGLGGVLIVVALGLAFLSRRNLGMKRVPEPAR